jgi:hypothetical protein
VTKRIQNEKKMKCCAPLLLCVGVSLLIWTCFNDFKESQEQREEERRIQKKEQQKKEEQKKEVQRKEVQTQEEQRKQQREECQKIMFHGKSISGVLDVVPKWGGPITAFYVEQSDSSVVCNIDWDTDCVAVQLIFVQDEIFIEIRKSQWQPRDHVCWPSSKTTWDLEECLRKIAVSFGEYHSISNASITKRVVSFLSLL